MTAPEFDAAVERAAREAFFTDDLGGHHKPGYQPHTWDNIPEQGRENYRVMIRAAFTAAGLPELLAENERLRSEVSDLREASEEEDEQITDAVAEAAAGWVDLDLEADTARDYVVTVVERLCATLAAEGERIAQAIEEKRDDQHLGDNILGRAVRGAFNMCLDIARTSNTSAQQHPVRRSTIMNKSTAITHSLTRINELGGAVVRYRTKDTATPLTEVWVEFGEYDGMGRPTTINVSIEPGDPCGDVPVDQHNVTDPACDYSPRAKADQ